MTAVKTRCDPLVTLTAALSVDRVIMRPCLLEVASPFSNRPVRISGLLVSSSTAQKMFVIEVSRVPRW